MRIMPKRLHQGDTVGVISPSSPPDLKNLNKALPFLEDLGLKVKMGQSVTATNGYLAGTDEERLADIHSMFEDPEVKGIICAGGGFGSARLAEHIDYAMIKDNPKIFWGYSDISFLHHAIGKYAELITFHGPMLAADVGKPEFHERSGRMFGQMFRPFELHYDKKISSLEVLAGGVADGELVGGNLSSIRSSLGTKFELDTKGKILLIEDTGKEPYQIDEMLNQLKQARKFEQVAGIVIGDFKNAEAAEPGQSWTLAQVLADYFEGMTVPVIKGFKIGHCEPNFSVPLGARARLDASHKTLTILPGVE